MASEINLFRVLPKILNITAKGDLPKILKGIIYNNTKGADSKVGLAHFFEKAVKKHPNNVAVYYERSSYTYKALNQWSNQIAHYLKSIGLGKGDVVCVSLENRPELLAISIACAKIGGVAALLNTSQKGDVLEHSINLVKPKFIVIGQEMLPCFQEVKDRFSFTAQNTFYWKDDSLPKISNELKGYTDFSEAYKGFSTDNLSDTQEVYAKDPLYYIYTSGTTGLPKASIISNGRWLKSYAAFGLVTVRLKSTDRLFVTLPFYHATAMVTAFSSTVASGAAIIMVRKFSASNFWKDVRKYKATCFSYVGELCRYLLNQPESLEDRNHSVTRIFGNGLRPAIWEEFKDRFGIEYVCEFYASSEGNIAFFNLFNFNNTVGFTVAKYAMVKYDKETGEPVRNEKGYLEKVKKGEPGVLLGQINKKFPFDGYTQKEKTEKVIVRDAFKKGDSWFNTGDLMKEIGFKHARFEDRLGDTFRWKGENVSTTQVENIANKFPSIAESVAYGVEIPKTNGRAGMLCLTLKESKQLDTNAFFSHLGQQLPSYAIPVFLRFRQDMDKTGTFKYKKSDLKKEAFYLEACNDEQVYVNLPKTKDYVKLTPEIEKGILEQEYVY